MGERFQFYIISESKRDNKKHITAIHDQWVWGGRAVKYTDNLIRTLKKTDWANMYSVDGIDTYIKSILSIRWHNPENKAKKFYYYHGVSVEDMDYSPDNADTNHGCVIIDITDTKKIKASFFDTKGEFVPVSRFNSEERVIDDSKLVKNVYDKLNKDDYYKLCSYMQDLYKLSKLSEP